MKINEVYGHPNQFQLKSISTSGKKSFSVEKKKPFKTNKTYTKPSSGVNQNHDIKKKILQESL